MTPLVLCSLQAAHSGGHKTLLYGHAILLRHSFSSMVRDGTRLPPIAGLPTPCLDVNFGDLNWKRVMKTPEKVLHTFEVVFDL